MAEIEVTLDQLNIHDAPPAPDDYFLMQDTDEPDPENKDKRLPASRLLYPNANGDVTISGKLGIGTNSPGDLLHTFSAGEHSVIFECQSADPGEVDLKFRKSRSGGVISSGDRLLRIGAYGHDGSSYIEGARIDMVSEGTIAAGRIPASIQFHTMGSSGSIAERMRIASNGNVGIGTSAPGSTLQVGNGSGIQKVIIAGSGLNSQGVEVYDNYTDGVSNVVFAGYLHNSSNADVLFGQIAISNIVRTAGAEVGHIKFNAYHNGAFNARMAIRGDRVGIGSGPASNPLGILHTHDGVGGMLHWSHPAVADSAVTIIPDGTGDITANITFLLSIEVGGNDWGNLYNINTGGSADIPLGTGTWRFAVSAAGAFTVQRVSGSGSAKITLLATWI